MPLMTPMAKLIANNFPQKRVMSLKTVLPVFKYAASMMTNIQVKPNVIGTNKK
ncbi:MAG: hypothetical protein ACD_29C00385G0001 [uncultured bacterium]|nr:MAG: hypothetical protein ACD_29C00385G0001 [uncultured bacterium]